jgi:hypothetical protein
VDGVSGAFPVAMRVPESAPGLLDGLLVPLFAAEDGRQSAGCDRALVQGLRRVVRLRGLGRGDSQTARSERRMVDLRYLQGFEIDMVVYVQGPREQAVDVGKVAGQIGVHRLDLGQPGLHLKSRGLPLGDLPPGGRGSGRRHLRVLVCLHGSLGLALRCKMSTMGGGLLLAFALLRLLRLVVHLREEAATFAHDITHKTRCRGSIPAGFHRSDDHCRLESELRIEGGYRRRSRAVCHPEGWYGSGPSQVCSPVPVGVQTASRHPLSRI